MKKDDKPEPDGWATFGEGGLGVAFEQKKSAIGRKDMIERNQDIEAKVEPFYCGSTIRDTMLGTEDQPLGLIDQVWQELLEKRADNSDVAWGIKIMARNLKYCFQNGEVFGRRTDEKGDAGE